METRNEINQEMFKHAGSSSSITDRDSKLPKLGAADDFLGDPSHGFLIEFNHGHQAPPLQIPVIGNGQCTVAVDGLSSDRATTGGSTLPSANRSLGPSPSSSPNLRSTSRNSPRDPGLASLSSSRHRLHHLLRFSAAADAKLLFPALTPRPATESVPEAACRWDWACMGVRKVRLGKLTPISAPRDLLLSWKNDPVDCK
uniref:Uncharacterized protein n=1 Tax=Kalanchoe fedtschenkoi TaxID=63787 RepID=A0A7N0ZTE1_KALFE